MMCLREILFMYLCLGFVELIGSLDRQSRQFQKKFWPLFLHFFCPLTSFLFFFRDSNLMQTLLLEVFLQCTDAVFILFSVFFPPSVFQFSVSIDISWSLLFFFQNVYSLLIPEECLFHIRDFTFYLWKFGLGLFIPSGFLCNTFSLFSSILDICNTVIIIVLLSLSTNSRTCHRFDGLWLIFILIMGYTFLLI